MLHQMLESRCSARQEILYQPEDALQIRGGREKRIAHFVTHATIMIFVTVSQNEINESQKTCIRKWNRSIKRMYIG